MEFVFDPRKQGWHDKWLGMAVRTKHPIPHKLRSKKSLKQLDIPWGKSMKITMFTLLNNGKVDGLPYAAISKNTKIQYQYNAVQM